MKKFLLFFVIPLFIFIPFKIADAYDDQTTHPALTSEIVDFYNILHPERELSSQEKEWIVEGSIKEDTPPRWMNHFYDPIRKEGWTGENAGNLPASVARALSQILVSSEKAVSAIQWVNDRDLQARFSRYDGDKTFKYGLERYVKGDTREAYIALGHTLHLLEDMSVPEHTRNDTHAPLKEAIGDEGSPFEDYLTKWDVTSIKSLGILETLKNENKKPPRGNSIEEYLISMAEYSNRYFFSKDTTNDLKYEFPKITREDEKFGYGVDESGVQFPLVIVDINVNKDGEKNKIYSIKNKEEYYPILDEYFSRLSKKVVLNGGGVIELFIKQIEDEKIAQEFPSQLVKYDFSFLRTPSFSFLGELVKLKNTAQSFWGSIVETTRDSVSLAKTFLGSAKEDPIKIITEESRPKNSQEINQQEAETDSTPEVAFIEEPETDIVDERENEIIEKIQIAKKENGNGKTADGIEKINKENVNKTETKTTSQTALTFSGGGGGSSYTTDNSLVKVFPKIIINEVQLASTSSTREEFIELYNPNISDVTLTDWYLQKKSASGNSFTTFAPKDLFATKTIPARGYLLIAHPSSTFAADIFTSYGVADNNTLALRNPNGEIVDKIGFGSAADCEGSCALNPSANQSVQRKFQNNTFIDNGNNANDFEIQDCPSPKERLGNCPASTLNTAPSAVFTVLPHLPLINQTVIFNAASSTDTDGNIVLYQWNFGDGQNTSSTQATSTHSYLASGNYTVRLIVFDNNNSSSTISSVLSVASSTSSNKIPNAYFVYTPENPNVGDMIIFNAASSTDDGAIISYQWDFGDLSADSGQTTSTILTATTTHTYSQAGSYQISLIVFDNQSASSTATSTTISVSSSGVNHLVISEIMAGNDTNHSEEEFIELYNPTGETVNLSGWSLKRKTSQSSTSTLNLVSNFVATSTIPAKGFFLIAHRDFLNYSTSTLPDFFYTGQSTSYRLAYSNNAILLYNNNDGIIDEVYYQNVDAGKSLERKSFSSSVCVSAQNDGEFLGNACDTDGATDFEIRSAPNPQNSQNFYEPRVAPGVPVALNASSSIAEYSSSSVSVQFAWQPSADFQGTTSTVKYRVTDASSSLDIFNGTSTSFSHSVAEVGRSYSFILQAFDRDGLRSATTSVAIEVPSFLDNLYFYRDPRASSTSYRIDLYYDKYPFIPARYSSGDSLRLPVFYLNRAPLEESDIHLGEPSTIPQTLTDGALSFSYYDCGRNSRVSDFMVLPDTDERCVKVGPDSSDFSYNDLEDLHLSLTLASSTNDVMFASSDDYISVAFYDYSSYYWATRHRMFSLVAVDVRRYYFSTSPPTFAAPIMNASTTVNFDEPNSRLIARWEKATDSDTLDNALTYEINFSPSGALNETLWQLASPQPRAQVDNLPPISYNYPRTVAPGDNFAIGVRAKDEFGNISNIATASWTHPPTASSTIDAAVSQLNDSVSSVSGYSNPTQTLGPNLSGTFTDMTVHFESQGSLIKVAMVVREFLTMPTSSNMTGYIQEWFPISDNYMREGATATFLASEYSTPIIFNPARFYAFMFYQLNRNFKGSGSDVIGGKYYYSIGNDPSEDPNVKDIYFVLNGV